MTALGVQDDIQEGKLILADELGLVAFLRELNERLPVWRGRSPSLYRLCSPARGAADCRPSGGVNPQSTILWSSVL